MDDLVFYESLTIAEWKKNKFQMMYSSKLEELVKEFIEYVQDNKFGEIDVENKSISIKSNVASKETIE